MAWLPLDIPWTSKPPAGTPPLATAKGLKILMPHNEYFGTAITNICSIDKAQFINSLAWNSNGVFYPAGNTTSYYTLPNKYIFGNTFSFFAIIAGNSSGAQSIIDNDFPGSSYRGFQFRLNAGKPEAIFFNTSAAVTTVTATNVPSRLGSGTFVGFSQDNTILTLVTDGEIKNSTQSGTGKSLSQAYPFYVGRYGNSAIQFFGNGTIVLWGAFNRALSNTEWANLRNNVMQLFQPQTIPVPFGAGGGGGGTTYTEALTALAESYAAVTDIATYIAAGEAIITAGVSAIDTMQMLEGILTTAQSASTATDVAHRVEALLTTIQAVDSVQTAATLVENLAVTITAEATVGDTLNTAGAENVTTAAESTTAVVDIAQYANQLQTAADSATIVQDLVTALEAVHADISAQVSVDDSVVSSTAENLLTVATNTTSVTDLQAFVDGLMVEIQSGASIMDIGAFIDGVLTQVDVGVSVIDAVVGQFKGGFVATDYVKRRVFGNKAYPRIFGNKARTRVLH